MLLVEVGDVNELIQIFLFATILLLSLEICTALYVVSVSPAVATPNVTRLNCLLVFVTVTYLGMGNTSRMLMKSLILSKKHEQMTSIICFIRILRGSGQIPTYLSYWA